MKDPINIKVKNHLVALSIDSIIYTTVYIDSRMWWYQLFYHENVPRLSNTTHQYFIKILRKEKTHTGDWYQIFETGSDLAPTDLNALKILKDSVPQIKKSWTNFEL